MSRKPRWRIEYGNDITDDAYHIEVNGPDEEVCCAIAEKILAALNAADEDGG